MSCSAKETATWDLFSDWCDATGHNPLPAAPLTLAGFLRAHPAAKGTQRRRVGTLNTVHRRRGYPPPGRSETVRELLDERRWRNRGRRAYAAAAAISLLPRTGWPTALFACRDAMLLALIGHGLSTAAIATLRMGDIREAADSALLEVDCAGETLTGGEELLAAGLSPPVIWRDWEMVRRVQHRLPSTRRVIQLIEGDPLPAVGPAPAQAPLFVALDRWGAAELNPVPLSAAAIARIVAGHLTGRPAVHKPMRRTCPPTVPDDAFCQETAVEPTVLDPGVVSRGLVARRRAIELLDGIGDQLDAVEARADALLEGLLDLLEEPEN